MRKYNQPETKFLQVVNSSIICASGGAAPAQVSISSVTKSNGEW